MDFIDPGGIYIVHPLEDIHRVSLELLDALVDSVFVIRIRHHDLDTLMICHDVLNQVVTSMA